jgi:NADPH:quinone reductase-like Zn-dependent oxidoreductase
MKIPMFSLLAAALPRPAPAPGQLLVRVNAAGAAIDALIREGKVELQPLPVVTVTAWQMLFDYARVNAARSC